MMKPLIITLLLILSFGPASAQAKKDIRGIYPGMPAGQALAEMQKMDCRLFATAEFQFTPTCIFRNGNFDKNEDLYVFLAGDLPDTPVWAVVLAFSSLLTRQQIADAIAAQFQVRMGAYDIAKPENDRPRIDIGGGLFLRLAPEAGTLIQGYRLSIWSADLKAQEDKAVVKNATPKF